jgi:hypothetical protein
MAFFDLTQLLTPSKFLLISLMAIAKQRLYNTKIYCDPLVTQPFTSIERSEMK